MQAENVGSDEQERRTPTIATEVACFVAVGCPSRVQHRSNDGGGDASPDNRPIFIEQEHSTRTVWEQETGIPPHSPAQPAGAGVTDDQSQQRRDAAHHQHLPRFGALLKPLHVPSQEQQARLSGKLGIRAFPQLLFFLFGNISRRATEKGARTHFSLHIQIQHKQQSRLDLNETGTGEGKPYQAAILRLIIITER